MQNRQNALHQWLDQIVNPLPYTLSPLAGDASFRRYFRLHTEHNTRIVMDAPPDREALKPFLLIAEHLSTIGIRTPKVYAKDELQGFLLLEDFGDALLLQQLNNHSADQLYQAAVDTINTLQICSTKLPRSLPTFNKEFMLSELSLFRDWFLTAYLKICLTSEEGILLQKTFDLLCEEISQQPQVFIHRDYHSRNLMLLHSDKEALELGVIDFQDAMLGPVTYDLVSLLKDCYVQWPRERVLSWLEYFYNKSTLVSGYTFSSFIRAFDLCGLQRHLKVLGVFSRLYLRDNKPNYLQDLPLTLHYTLACLESYEELKPFYEFLRAIRLPDL